ncbi:hypothetical protein, conserved [Eimeria praecox]|uniref:AMP-dependent synthetase/ligase domain-containing protein n=1 Tax=Eimeria praecox TaxID=51316 RepID=U6H0C6_9EIME|nr:hypothetical protein, conserved [Eimeria praecox]
MRAAEVRVFPFPPLAAASSSRSFFLVLHVLLLLLLLRDPALAASPGSHNGSTGLQLSPSAQREERTSAARSGNSLSPFDSVQGITEDAKQALKGSSANEQGQKEVPAQPSSSSHAQESHESPGNKATIAAESPPVPPGLAADSNISIRRPFDLLRKAAALYGDYPWLLTSEEEAGEGFFEITYKQGYAVSLAVGSGLDRLVLPSQLPQRDGANEPLRLVGTWAANSVELLLADFGDALGRIWLFFLSYLFLSVASGGLWDDRSADASGNERPTVFRSYDPYADDPPLYRLEAPGDSLRPSRGRATLEFVGDQAVQRAQALDVTLVDFWELADSPSGIGEQRLKSLHRPGFDTEEIAAVIYPRALSMPFNGVMLSNENVLSSLDSLTDWRTRALSIMEGDRVLCIDSLASIHQRVLHLAVVEAGATVAFARNGLLTLGEDLEALQPTVVAASGGILPMLHAAATRTLKSLGRLRRFWVLLKLRWRARKYWQTGDFELLGKPKKGNEEGLERMQKEKAQHKGRITRENYEKTGETVQAGWAVPSNLELIFLLLYFSSNAGCPVACCSAETGIAFSSREQNSSFGSTDDSRSASDLGAVAEFERIRAAPLGWPSPVVLVDLQELSAADKANAVDYHGEELPGRRAGGSSLVLKTAQEDNHQQIVSIGRSRSRSRLSSRRRHGVTEGEIVIQGPCVSVGYYRHQTAFQRHLTSRGFYKTGLVGVSAGDGFPLLLTSFLSRSVLTAEGEFIDLEEAERQIRKVHIVRRVLLYADDFHSPLVAIVQPRRSAVLRWAKSRFAFSDEYGASYEELVSLPALRMFVLNSIREETSLNLEHFELPRAVYLVPHDVELPVAVFDQDKKGASSDHLMSRQQLAEAYAQPIQEILINIGAVTACPVPEEREGGQTASGECATQNAEVAKRCQAHEKIQETEETEVRAAPPPAVRGTNRAVRGARSPPRNA